MRSPSTAERHQDEPLRFHGPTLEDAVDAALTALGGRVRVVEANRIRRGGIGGFFATDLGVEVAVVAEEADSMDEALRRLVEQTSAHDGRVGPDSFARTLAREMSSGGTEGLPPIRPRRAANYVVAEPPMSPADSFHTDPIVILDQPSVERRRVPTDRPRRHERSTVPVDDLPDVTAEEILAELAALTGADDRGGADDPAGVAPAGGRPQRPRRIHRTRSRAVAAAPTSSAARVETALAGMPVTSTASASPAGGGLEPPPTALGDDVAAPKRARRNPVGRQVELAVSAAGELVRQVAGGVDGSPRISVKVVVTTADGSQVEAEAQLGGAA